MESHVYKPGLEPKSSNYHVKRKRENPYSEIPWYAAFLDIKP